MIKIALTGPESTGKSTLAKELSKFYNTPLVEEYSRVYLKNLKRPYTFEDINRIASSKISLEDKYSGIPLLFCDTELLVCKIWQEYKFGYSDEALSNNFKVRHYDLFLLCNTDIQWEFDPLREHPYERDKIFRLYEEALSAYQKPYEIISGNGNQRFINAIDVIERILKP